MPKKVRIILQTIDYSDGEPARRSSELWSGELEIANDREYIAKVSFIVEGVPQPLVDIPFSIGVGHYEWIPPSNDEVERADNAWHLS